MERRQPTLVYGVGVNDADYAVYKTKKVGTKYKVVWRCPYYGVWASMLARCYNAASQAKQPSYVGCKVCDEWLTFSNFRAWMKTQGWPCKALDKDILVLGNKVYSPDTCVFVTQALNNFLSDHAKGRGAHPIGVYWYAEHKAFAAQCSNPFTERLERIGLFDTPEEAHEAWRKRKHELACQYADMQTDPRIAAALRVRFAPKETTSD